MSRRVWTWIFVLLFFVVTIVPSLWAFGTEQGSRWTIGAVLRILPVEVRIGQIAGRLAGRLELREIRIRTNEWDVSVDRFAYLWQPLHFFSGTMAIKEIAVGNVFLTDKYPEIRRPVDLAWPKPPQFLSWFSGWVDSLRVGNFVYRSGQREVRLIDDLSARLSWFFGDLTLKNLRIETPVARAQGHVQTAFRRPFFFANLSVNAKEAIAGFDRFVLDVDLKRVHDPELMSGIFRIVAGPDERLHLAGNMRVERHALKLSDLRGHEKGRKGGLSGAGDVDFSSVEPRINLHVSVSDVDASKELRTQAIVSGNIKFQSDFRDFRGSFSLRNPGPAWRKVEIAGTFEGNQRELKFAGLKGKLLNGILTGTVNVAFGGEAAISGSLQAREMDPAAITPEWKGRINADIGGALRWPKGGLLEGTVKAELLSSVLRGKALTGKIDAQWRKGVLDLTRADLHGNGFDLSASGVINERLTYQAQVQDLSGLVPGSRGRFTAGGWTKWHDGLLAGVLKGRGSKILVFGMGIGEMAFEASLGDNGSDILQGRMKAKDVAYGPFKFETAEAKADGTVSSHTVELALGWPGSGVRASFQGGFANGVWQGAVTGIDGTDARFGAYKLSGPAPLKISEERLMVGAVVLTGGSSEKLEFTADLLMHPRGGSIRTRWRDLNMARVNGMLASPQVSGRTSGSFEATWQSDTSVNMAGSATVTDAAVNGPSGILLPKGEMKFEWTKRGLTASLGAAVGSAGKFEGRFGSDEPARLSMPETGRYSVNWSGLDVGIMKAGLPAGIDMGGFLNGQAKGQLLSGSRLEMEGQAKLSQGTFTWKGNGGTVSTKAEEASLDIDWQKDSLKGGLTLVLLNRGSLKAQFQLPLPANFPARINPAGPLRLSAKGEVSEKGILTAIFPGLIGESEGQLAFELTAAGTWQAPDLQGKARIAKASAYLNPAGIRIRDITGEADFRGDRVNVGSFRAVSGSGSVQGSAAVLLGGGRIVRYEGRLTGEKFQALHLPEVQASVNPDLSFEGDLTKFALRGSINVPDALIRYEGKEGGISPSSDVVIVDAPERQKKPSRMGIDMRVNVILGDNVRIEAQGVSSRLEGKVLLVAQSFERITADGMIQTVKGQFKRRGITLDIVRGRVLFAGKEVDLAALDVLAVRKIRDPNRFNDIQAGVTVTGTLRSPLVKLYSEPAMTDADILAYMVLGKPLSAGTESSQASLLAQAAGTLLAKDQSTSLQSQIMKFTGIDTIEMQASGQPTGGQPATVQQTGTPQIGSGQISSIQPTGGKAGTPAAGASAVTSSIVTVGKYLSPELYVAFGRALFSNDYLVTTRYSLFRHWEVEGSRRGVETGADLYYKIEFK